jgi:hypothetical protein
MSCLANKEPTAVARMFAKLTHTQILSSQTIMLTVIVLQCPASKETFRSSKLPKENMETAMGRIHREKSEQAFFLLTL